MLAHVTGGRLFVVVVLPSVGVWTMTIGSVT